MSGESKRSRSNDDISASLLSEKATDEDIDIDEIDIDTSQSEPVVPKDPKRDDDTQSPAETAADKDTRDEDSETPMIETTQSEEEAVPLLTEELDFTWEELELLEDACVISCVGPHALAGG